MPVNTEFTRANLEADCRSWPEKRRLHWLELFDADNPLRDGRWARQTAYDVARVYSRYLSCVRGRGLGDAVNPAGLRAFVTEREARSLAPRTIAAEVWKLYRLERLMEPSADLSWLARSAAAMEEQAERTPPRKTLALNQVSAEAVHQIAVEAILEAQRAPSVTWPATQLFRDGLFLLLGLMCPERRRALESLRVSQVDIGARRIVFDASQIKTATAQVRELPPELVLAIEVWLEKWRGRYAPTHDGLWIAKGGRPVGSGTLYAGMRKLTEDRLGVSLSPHRLRDLAATFVVETAPERAALASAMLAHRSMAMTQKYTLTASQIEASRMGHAILDAAERAVRKRAL